MLSKITPMRTNIAQRGCDSAFGGIRTPRIDVRIIHPVLQIIAAYEAQGACFATRHHPACLLYQRVAPVIEGDDMRYLSGHRCVA